MMESVLHHNNSNLSLAMQAIINRSGEKHYLIQQFSYNRNIDEPYYSILIALYGFLIIFGATGNVMVVLAVLRNKQMQTAR
jgi:neuropeptide F receptor